MFSIFYFYKKNGSYVFSASVSFVISFGSASTPSPLFEVWTTTKLLLLISLLQKFQPDS